MKFPVALSSLHRTLSLSVGLKVLSTATTFGVSVLLARTLNVEQYGVYAFWLSVLMLLLVPLQTGVSHFVVREGSVAFSDRGEQIFKLALRAAKWVLLYALLIVTVATLALGAVGPSTSASGGISTFYCGALLIMLVPLTAIAGSATRALGGANWGQLPDRNVRPLVFLLLLVVATAFPLAGKSLNAASAMVLHSAASAIALISAFLILKHHLSFDKSAPDSGFAPMPARQLLIGVGSFGLLAILQLLNASVGVLILGIVGTDSDVGQFRVAAQLAGLASFGLAAINPALHSRFAMLIANDEKVELQKVVSTGVRLSILVAMPPVAFLLFAPTFTLSFIFGDQYQSAASILQVLLIGQIVNVVFGPVAALLNMGGHQKLTIYAMAAAVTLNAFASVCLWPTYGPHGVAVGTVVGFFAWNFALWLAIRKKLAVNSAIWC